MRALTEIDLESPQRLCEHPTRAGTPCRNGLREYDVRCLRHADEHDQLLLRRADALGFERGQRSQVWTIESLRDSVERLTMELVPLRQQREDEARTYEIDGKQVVEIDGKLSYLWGGDPPLRMGEHVILPGNLVCSSAWRGVVTGYGTTYTGVLSYVMRRA